MRKDTSIFSELQEFFQQNDSHRAIIRIVGIMRSLHIHEKQIINRQLITRLSVRTDSKKSGKPVCIVADDTDLPKTGKHMELMGRVHSHVLGISRLGFKGLFLARTDGKTQTILDVAVLGEEGKDPNKPHGMTIVDKIWNLIVEVVTEIAEQVSADYMELMHAAISGNSHLHHMFVHEYAKLEIQKFTCES